jgi:serine/threonine-protein kinase
MPTSAFSQHFPGYEILGELGRSNARVLKARNQFNGELVAIKHFSFNTDPATLRRFQQESEIMTTIKHPNIVKIKEVQLDSEMPYVVMELIEGGDLRNLLKESGHLDTPSTIRLGLQMAEAFKIIHQQGIIHRDIKPENIMYRLLPSGELHFLLTDFGIAKVREQSVTVTGQSLMTYEYASPEQFDNPKGVTAATDYYSLGVVLYECLSGRVPFILEEGRMHSFINKVMDAPPPPLSLPAESPLPESLRTLVNSLLAKKPEDRIKDELTLRRKLKRAEIEEIEGPSAGTPAEPEKTKPAPVKEFKSQGGVKEPEPVKKVIPPEKPKEVKSNTGKKVVEWIIGIILALVMIIPFLKKIMQNDKSDHTYTADTTTFTYPADTSTTFAADTTARVITRDTTSHYSTTLYYDNGRYEGEVVNNLKQGKGTYYWKNAGRYTGDWKNDVIEGNGIYYSETGDKYDGEWVNGKMQGTGTKLWNDGSKYEGGWYNDQRWGKGTYTMKSGDKYTGDWKNDVKDGYGIYYWNNSGSYEGYWKNNNMDGFGKYYDANGKLMYEGEWKEGKSVEAFPNRY